MHFLICISGGEQARRTLTEGVKIAQSFHADLGVLYVDTHQRMAFSNSIAASRKKLSEWELEHPGVKRLRFAREILREMGVIRLKDGALDERHPLRAEIAGAYENHFYGEDIRNIRLRLREGRLIDQIRKEVQAHHYDVTIVGGVDQVANARRLIQFVETSFVVIKQSSPGDFNLLYCSDISDSADRALMFGAKVAKAMHSRVDILRVAEQETVGQATKAVYRADTLLRRGGIQHEVIIKEGKVLEQILETAGAHYAIVMGASRRSELMKFFIETTPMKVIERAKSHVIVVK